MFSAPSSSVWLILGAQPFQWANLVSLYRWEIGKWENFFPLDGKKGTLGARTHLADYRCAAIIPCHSVTGDQPPTMERWYLKFSLYLQGQIFSRHFLPHVHSLRTHQKSSLQFPSPLNSALQQLSLLKDLTPGPTWSRSNQQSSIAWAPPPASSLGSHSVTTREVSWLEGSTTLQEGHASSCPQPGLPWSLTGKAPRAYCRGPASQHPPRELLAASQAQVIVKVIDCIRSLELKGNLNIMHPSALTIMSYKLSGNLVKMQISDFINCNRYTTEAAGGRREVVVTWKCTIL